MKRSPDNQINASFIDISRIKWLVFFYCGRLSSAQLDRLDKFLAGTSKAQVLDKGIRQKFPKRVNSFIACRAFCPGPPNCDARDAEKRWRVYTSISMMARHGWRVYKSSGKNTKKSECVY